MTWRRLVWPTAERKCKPLAATPRSGSELLGSVRDCFSGAGTVYFATARVSLGLFQRGCYGLRDVALSVPTVVGRGGAERCLEIDLWPKELQGLKRSGGVLAETLGTVLG